MPTPANSINEATTGITGFTSTSFVGSPTTQYNVQVGGSTSSTLSNVAPSATTGIPLVSQGSSSNPAFSTAVVGGGGTGAVTLTNHGVLIGQGTSAIAATAAGTAGQVLQSGGAAADPTYSTPTYPSTSGTSGKVLISNGTNNVYSTPTFPNASATSGKIIISDGTNWIASTPTYPNTSGTAGKVVVSDGTNNVYSTPTFPNASATSRKIIVSDSTNWVASTETWAVPGTSGNILTSDGTNWTSATPSNVLFTQINMSSATFKLTNTTPVEIVAAPGSGNIIVVLQAIFKLNYGGTNAFSGTGLAAIIYSTLTSNEIFTWPTTAYTGISTRYSTPTIVVETAQAFDNKAVQYFTKTANPAGNAAGNNTVSVGIWYQIVTLT